MINLIRGEFYKLKKSKCFVGMIFLWALFSMMIVYCLIKDAHANISMCGVLGIAEFLQLQIFFNFLYATFAGLFISNDFSNNTINRTFTYGYSRSQVILSKIIVYVLYSLLLEVVTAVITGILFTKMYGFNNFDGVNIQLYLFRVIFVSMLCIIASSLIIAVVSVLSKSIIITLTSAFAILWIINFTSGFEKFAKAVFCILPCASILVSMAPFAPKGEIIITIVSSIIVSIISVLVIIKHLNKLDIK